MQMSLKQHIDDFSSALVSSSEESNDLFIDKIKQTSKISPLLAIDIYKNNTRGARINALKVIYPACKSILGNDIFYSIATEFIKADNQGQPDLNTYGAGFNEHMSTMLNTGRLPIEYSYMPELAKLELLVHATYYADNDSIFDFELFEYRIQKELPVYLQTSHSLALLAFQTPIYEIWLHNVKTPNSNDFNHKDKVIQRLTETQYLLTYRENFKPVVLLINHCEYQILNACVNNESLQSIICNYDCNVENILPKLIDKKWISDIK